MPNAGPVGGIDTVSTLDANDGLLLADGATGHPRRILRDDAITELGGGGGGGAAGLPHATGQLYLPPWTNPSLIGAGTRHAEDAAFIPWWIKAGRTLHSATTYCSTAEAGSTLRLGVHEMDDNMNPGDLIVDLGTVSGASTGAKTVSDGSTVLPGQFCLTAWFSNHSTVCWFRHTGVAWAPLGEDVTNGPAFTKMFICRVKLDVDYSAGLPDPGPSPDFVGQITNESWPMVYLRFQ
jgi:hypothetical protein